MEGDWVDGPRESMIIQNINKEQVSSESDDEPPSDQKSGILSFFSSAIVRLAINVLIAFGITVIVYPDDVKRTIVESDLYWRFFIQDSSDPPQPT